jgi:hypothetical protein
MKNNKKDYMNNFSPNSNSTNDVVDLVSIVMIVLMNTMMLAITADTGGLAAKMAVTNLIIVKNSSSHMHINEINHTMQKVTNGGEESNGIIIVTKGG